MDTRPLSYPAQKLSDARQSLMLPHLRGEERAIADSLSACHVAFRELRLETIADEDVRDSILAVKRFLDTTGVQDLTGRGLWFRKAFRMPDEDRAEFSRCVNELANWFARMAWAQDFAPEEPRYGSIGAAAQWRRERAQSLGAE